MAERVLLTHNPTETIVICYEVVLTTPVSKTVLTAICRIAETEEHCATTIETEINHTVIP